MVPPAYRNYNFLRNTIGLLLILTIGVKTAIPVYNFLKSTIKEVSTAPSSGENDDEKKAETNSLPEKETDYADVYANDMNHVLWFTHIKHYTAYHNNYQISHSLKITIPPPDFIYK